MEVSQIFSHISLNCSKKSSVNPVSKERDLESVCPSIYIHKDFIVEWLNPQTLVKEAASLNDAGGNFLPLIWQRFVSYPLKWNKKRKVSIRWVVQQKKMTHPIHSTLIVTWSSGDRTPPQQAPWRQPSIFSTCFFYGLDFFCASRWSASTSGRANDMPFEPSKDSSRYCSSNYPAL